jgi:hypothetical protein
MNRLSTSATLFYRTMKNMIRKIVFLLFDYLLPLPGTRPSKTPREKNNKHPPHVVSLGRCDMRNTCPRLAGLVRLDGFLEYGKN